MQELIIKEKENIKDKICMVRGIQVILDPKMSATKYHNYLNNKIVTQ